VRLPRLGLGTAALGGLFAAVDDDEALATIDRAWERGIRFFDTAPLYGHGLAEDRLGRALAGRARDEYVLATKVGRLLRTDAPPDPGQSFWHGAPAAKPVFDFSADGVRRSHVESLDRLGLDRVDVLHVHDPDDHYEEALSGALPALGQLRDEGAIEAVGVGMNQVELPARFVREAGVDCLLVAGRWTLLDRSAGADLLPLCRDRGVAVIAGGALNSGLLAGGATFDYLPAPPAWRDRAARLGETCRRHDVPLLAAALQFPLRHPAVASLLLGPRSVAELDESLDALTLEIPDYVWDELDSASRHENAGS
jgi:D-threo-aldose 1-dehydrogenase